MGRFMRTANAVKLNGVNPDVIKLQLFPFSLRDVAVSWFESLPYRSVNNWEKLVETYLSRFSLILSLQRGEEKLLYLSKEKMRVSTMHRRGTKGC